jgi:peptide/nickel transport system ATP-binding protein
MSQPGRETLLDVRDLTVDFLRDGLPLRVVDGVTFSVGKSERVALVGESGSGKSVMAQALMRLNPRARIGGTVRLRGRKISKLSDEDYAALRGAEIGMAFQDPMTSLDPLMTIGDQIMETLVIHGANRTDARRNAIAVLEELGVPGARERLGAYVHEFSGGMRQRVVLAMALIGRPALLIADEPTTALDVRIQQQVLDVLEDIADARALSVVLITHDLGIVASFAQRVMVMYAGRIVEDAQVDDLFARPLHPYTAGLLAAVPRADRDTERLGTIPGALPPPFARPTGCAFHPRCGLATEICRTSAPRLETHGARRVACHHARAKAEVAHAV